MCKQCEISPVYEFTNKKKLCKTCYTRWFQKKFFYTIRKFNMIKKNDVVFYHERGDFRDVVLEKVLEMYTEKAHIHSVKLSKNKMKIANKIAIPLTIDLESEGIVYELIRGDIKKIKPPKSSDKIIKPLYLFSDEEVLLYARLMKLKFKIKRNKPNKISEFISNLEKKHPEIKRAVVSGFLKLGNQQKAI